MKKLLVLAATTVGFVVVAAAPASAGSVCYEVNVGIAGQAPIAQAACQDLPDLP